MTPFDAYQMYLALKSHFSSDKYDYFKYQGKVKVSQQAFDRRNDKYMFTKLAKKKHLEAYIVANIIVRDTTPWAGDLIGDKAESTYTDWLKRNESFSYIFRQELKNLEHDEINDILISKNGQHPILLKRHLAGDVSLESLIVLNSLMGFFGMWDTKIQDTVIWPIVKKKCLKYEPFLKYDKKKARNIALEIFEG